MTSKYCVYQIEISGKFQIGSTNNVKRRMSEHISKLRLNKHHNKYMQNAYNKHKDFSYVILHEFNTREEAYAKEQELLNIYCGSEGYLMLSNSAYGAPVGALNPMKNIKTVEKVKKFLNTEEERIKRSIRMSGENNHMKNTELKARFSEMFKGEKNPMYGKISPMRGKRNIGASLMMKNKKGELHPCYGKKWSDKKRKEMSERFKGVNNPMYGKTGADSVSSIVVIDTETNRLYFSMKEYCQSNNTSMYKCRKMIKNGRLKCTT